MRMIQMIVDDITEELEGAEHYAECHVQAKMEGDLALAERFRLMAEQELSHADFHHERAVHAIEKLEKFYRPTNEMREKWEICHKEFVKKHEWIKDLIGKWE